MFDKPTYFFKVVTFNILIFIIIYVIIITYRLKFIIVLILVKGVKKWKY